MDIRSLYAAQRYAATLPAMTPQPGTGTGTVKETFAAAAEEFQQTAKVIFSIGKTSGCVGETIILVAETPPKLPFRPLQVIPDAFGQQILKYVEAAKTIIRRGLWPQACRALE